MKITIDITPSEYEVLLTAVTDYAVKSVEFLDVSGNVILGDCMALQEKLKEARKNKAND